MFERLSRSSTLLLVIIGGAAIGLLVGSYQYSSFTSQETRKIAAQDIRSNAEIEAHDIANNLKNKIDAVRSNLALLSSISGIENHDVESSKYLFSDAQKATGDITSSYFWVDQNGKLIWANAFENQTIYNQYAGDDRSFRSYFSKPKDTLKSYLSPVIESVDGVPRLYIAYPLILNSSEGSNNTPKFNGVVVSAIEIDRLGRFLQGQLSPKFESSFGMTDRYGTILYTSNTTYIGKNVFGNEFQASLPADIRDSFNSFMRDSLSGSAGSGDITYRGSTSTIAYQPVSFTGEQFGVVYIVAPHEFQETVEPLIDQQRNFNLIIIGLIAAIAVGTAYLVLTWNRRLSAMVKSKTAELEEANKSLQDALEQLKVHDRMQREFINVAAHELRTPTQAIIGYSELFYIRPESRDEAMKAIARNSERLDRLTSAILDVTRIEGQKLILNREKFNLSEVLSSAVEDAKSTIGDSNVKFEHSTLRNIVVEADRERISQVISNLLNNAVKFTKRGTIYISEETKDGRAVVSIKDTGTGIDPEIMSMLFTKFTTKSQTGTGLGLFIAKSIIEAHGGRIWAENNKDAKGATFIFSLPLPT